MEILGVGPSELLFIIVLALIILGPRDMQKAGRTLGRWLRTVVTSDGWKYFQQTSREIQTLPNRLMREAALEELKEMERDLQRPIDAAPQAATSTAGTGTVPSVAPKPSSDPEPTILPSPPPPARAPDDRDPDA